MVLLACSSQIGKTFDECRLLYSNAVVVGVVDWSNYEEELATQYSVFACRLPCRLNAMHERRIE